MGLTSIVLISHDQLYDIKKMPDFGSKLADAVCTSNPATWPYLPGVKIVSRDHNDTVSLVLVNGGVGKLVSVYGDSSANITTDDGQIEALQKLVANLGYKLIKRPKVKKLSRVERNARRLDRRKAIRVRPSTTKWQVVKRKRVDKEYHMLCRNGKDYVVFSFLLDVPSFEKHIPSDKFTYGYRRGVELFEEISSRVTAR